MWTERTIALITRSRDSHPSDFMGRIKTSFIKKIARDLLEKNSDKFSKDFETNKKIVEQFIDIKSKRIRNIVAGYITSIKKKELK